MGLSSAGVATDISHQDSVSGAALCGLGNSPLLLVPPEQMEEAIEFFEERRSVFGRGYVIGGTSVLGEEFFDSLEEAVAHA